MSNISIKHENMIYLSYVIYNYIVIYAKIQINKSIVLDPITTMINLIYTNKSFVRFGDGEITILEKKNLQIGIMFLK